MRRRLFFALLPVPLLLLATDDQAWKTKKIADWTPDDCRQLLSDSPWAKTVTPSVEMPANQGRPGGGRMGRGGIGIGMPGMGGMGRRGGMGGGGMGGGGGSRRSGQQSAPPMLYLRWESALPVREAELKSRDTNAPTLDEGHYAIAVFGVPNRIASADAKNLPGQLKKQASIKREGKKALKPSSVEVLQRDEGTVIVYLFPRTEEITKQDRRLEFDAKIGALHLAESFFVEDMVFQDKLEL